MSQNALVIPDSAPSYLSDLMNDPSIMAENAAMIAGISVGMHPMVGTSGTRFVIKEGGNEEIIALNGAPISVLGVVVLSAKAQFEKKYYESAYDPKVSTEPSCQSADGVTPDSGVPNQQNPTCAGCWANAFNSAVDQNGNPAKGKACSDTKKLAIFAAGKVYGFAVPPASLKNWLAYVKDLNSRGIPVQGVITQIGFDVETPQILTFKFGGMLAPEKAPLVIGLMQSKEVKEIVTFKLDGKQAALPAPAQQQQIANGQPAQVAQQPAQAQVPSQPETVKRQPRAAKPPAAAAPVAEAAPIVPDPLGLGELDGGAGVNMTDDAAANLLGL